MKGTIKKDEFVFITLSLLSVLVGMIITFVLPDRFFNDSIFIVNDTDGIMGWHDSYPITIMLYHISGLNKLHFSLIALIQLPILFYILKKIGIPDRLHVLTIKNIVFYLVFLMMGVFMGQPTKEFITFPFIALIVFTLTKRYKKFKTILALTFLYFIIFGAVFRPYFMFMPFIAIGMFLVTKIKLKNKALMAIFNGILVLIFISLTHGIVKGKHLSEISRVEVSEASLKNNQNINTLITVPINTTTWYGEAINTFYGFFTVNTPLNGFKFITSPQVLAFVVWELILFWILIVRFSKCLYNPEEYKAELWVFLYVFAYFIIQGLFEPDLGTAIRHKVGIFPLIYYALYYEDFRKKV